MTVKAKPRKQLARKLRKLSGRNPRFWLAMGTLAVSSVATKTQYVLAYPTPASGSGPVSKSFDQVRALPVRRFDIPPGPVGAVSDAFSKATGIQINLADPALRDVASPGVSGLYNDEQAWLNSSTARVFTTVSQVRCQCWWT